MSPFLWYAIMRSVLCGRVYIIENSSFSSLDQLQGFFIGAKLAIVFLFPNFFYKL